MDKGVNGVLLYREGNSQVWNRSEQGDVRYWGFRWGKAVGEGGLAGARVCRRMSRRVRSVLGPPDAMRIFFLGFFLAGVRAWLWVVGCRLLLATPCGGVDLRGGCAGEIFFQGRRWRDDRG